MENDGDNPFEGATAPLEKKPAIRIADSEVSLVVIEGADRGRRLSIDASSPPRSTLGSGPACDLVLADRLVSRRHAAIELQGDSLQLTDLGSKNGTFVNGVAVLAARLSGGEVVRVGASALRVELGGAARHCASTRESFGPLVGSSTAMRRVYGVLERLAANDLPVLVEGERGTGKSLTAVAIHEASARSAGPLVAVACQDVGGARGDLEAAASAAAGGTSPRSTARCNTSSSLSSRMPARRVSCRRRAETSIARSRRATFGKTSSSASTSVESSSRLCAIAKATCRSSRFTCGRS